MKVVARQKQWVLPFTVGLGLVVVIAGIAGFCFIEAPFWFLTPWSAWLVFCGAVFIAVGVVSWFPDGVVLAVGDDGLLWHAPVLRCPQRLIRWSDIQSVRVVPCGDREDGDAVVLFLGNDTANPLGRRYAEHLSCTLRERFGEPMAANVVFLEDERWTWDPHDVARQIRERILPPACGTANDAAGT